MDPLVGIGLFVGIPVGLAALIAIAILVPQRYGSAGAGTDGDTETDSTGGLITSSPAAPDPTALPSATSRVAQTGGARGHW